MPGARGAGEKLSPVVRRLLSEHALDPAQVVATGRDGRITREDVLAYIAGRAAAAPAARSVERTPRAIAVGAQRVLLNSVRRRAAEHVTKSWTIVLYVL